MPTNNFINKNLSDEDIKRLHRKMLLIRKCEEHLGEATKNGAFPGAVHLYIGQEAIAVPLCDQLEDTDWISSTHRGHGHFIAKGGDIKQMMAEIYGKSTGVCGGKGGSMHVADFKKGIIGANGVVAGGMGLAVGAALAAKMDKKGAVSVIFFGDGAANQGVLMEALNISSLWNLPMIFVCENNLYSVYTQLHERQPDRPITSLAEAHGIPTYHCDGNDVEEVYRSTLNALKNARSNKGPSFLLLDTYRWLEHCGPNFDNDIGYRTEAEFRIWKNRDPVILYKKNLLKKGILTEEGNVELKCEIQKEITAAFDFAKNSPYPDHSTAINHVYA